MKIKVNECKPETEEDIRKEWERIHSPGMRIDGFPDTYEEFKNEIITLRNGEKNSKIRR